MIRANMISGIANLTNPLTAALDYARRGWFVFPIYEVQDHVCACAAGATCANAGKHPRTAHGLREATTDEKRIRAWWASWPSANIAVATEQSNLLVVDVDPKHGGDETLFWLEREHGEFQTLFSLTGGGGTHHFFRAADDVQIASRTNAFGSKYPGIDVRGVGGYVVVPPSTHVSGQHYAWEISSPSEPAPLPQWLLDMLQAREHRPIAGVDVDEIIPQGQRNTALTQFGGRLRRLGTGTAALESALLAVNEWQCSPPLQKHEVQQIARSIGRYSPSEKLRGDGEQPAGWPLESAASIVARGVQPVEFDVESLLTRDDGPGIMFGPPGALKSFLAANLAGCIATGKPFLGHYPVRQRRFAIFVNFDAGANAFARRIARLGFSVENLLVTSPENYDAAALRSLCESHPEAFVVIDTFSDVYRSKAGEDPAQAMRRFVRDLRRLYAEFRCNGLILDHPRRPRDGEAHGDYYGSTQKEATARVMWQVTRLPYTEEGVVRAKIACRKMSEAEPFSPFVAKVDFRGAFVVVTYDGELDQSAAVAVGPSDVEVIEQILRGAPDGMTCEALKARSGRSRDRVLDAVKESRKILTLGKGRATRYRLLESPGLTGDSPGDLEISLENRPESSATLGGPGDPGDLGGRVSGSESPGDADDSPDDFTEIEI
jgi:hypothetical protein